MRRHRENLENVKLNKQTLLRIFSYAKKQTPYLVLFLGLILLTTYINTKIPLVFKNIIDVGIAEKRRDLIVRYALLATSFSVVGVLLSLLTRFVSTLISQRFVTSIQKEMFSHIQTLSLSYFTKMKTGALVQRIQHDVRGAQSIFTDTLNNVVSNSFTLIFVLITMLKMNVKLTLLLLLGIPLMILPMLWLRPKLVKLTRQSFELRADLSQLASERFNVAGAYLMKTEGNLENDFDLYSDTVDEIKGLSMKQTVLNMSNRMMVTFVSSLSLALIYGLGGSLALDEVITVGTLLAMASYVNKLYNPIISLSNLHLDFLMAVVSFERVFEVLDTQPEVIENDVKAQITTPSIRFDNVNFGYEDQLQIRNVSFTLNPGETGALVGFSGAGKSTISKLLLRLYDPIEGDIYIGDSNLKDVSFKSLNQKIGVVSQEAHVFHDTIANNLRYVKKDASDETLIKVLKDVLLWDMIENLPEGLDTVVGDSGYRLSGGEKQRLAIARLLLKDPDIIILDEASSSLDTKSEKEIQKILNSTFKDKTILMIAHRLSTIENADKIIVLENGEIKETGDHNYLMNKKGLYAHFVNLQALS